MTPDAAAEAAVRAVASHPWDTTPRSAHQDHVYDAECAVCQGDVPALVAVAVKAAAPLIAAQARREAAEQIAAAITDRRCTFRACNACLCRREDAQAALDTFPKETPDA